MLVPSGKTWPAIRPPAAVASVVVVTVGSQYVPLWQHWPQIACVGVVMGYASCANPPAAALNKMTAVHMAVTELTAFPALQSSFSTSI